MSAHVVVVEHVDSGGEYVVARRPKPRRHGDLLAHEYVWQERVEGNFMQECRRGKQEPGRYERSVFGDSRDLLIKGQ